MIGVSVGRDLTLGVSDTVNGATESVSDVCRVSVGVIGRNIDSVEGVG